MPSEYRSLARTWGRIKGSITRVVSYAENPPSDHTLEQVTSRLEALQDIWSEFVRTTDKLYDYEDSDNFIDPDEDFAIYEAKFLMARGLLSQHQLNLTSTKTSVNGGQTDHVSKMDTAISQLAEQQATFLQQVAHVTNTPRAQGSDLPRINIQPFSGQYKDWPSFKDLFTSSVGQNQGLTKTQKFHYLKSLLRNEAANLVRHIPITEAAFDTAWIRLNDRFDRPHLIVNCFIETFMNLPTTSRANAVVLRKISDGANEVVRGLEAVSRSDRDCWLIHLLVAKIDTESRRYWINDIKNNTVPTVQDFLAYLDSRCEELEMSERLTNDTSKPTSSFKQAKQPTRTFLAETSTQVCSSCKSADHTVTKCPAFLALNINDRRADVKEKSLCFNCLKGGHTSYSCASKFRCKQCNRRHHTLVHSEGLTQNSGVVSSSANIPEVPTSTLRACSSTAVLMTRPNAFQAVPLRASNSTNARSHQRSVLPTALVNVRTASGDLLTCRALLDSASELSYITERCVRALGLPRVNSRIGVSGISSGKAETTHGWCDIRIQSRVSSLVMDIRTHILTNITSSLPRATIDVKAIKQLDGLPLADPSFNISSQVDILLGSQYVWDIFKAEKIFDTSGAVIAVSSVFGWVIVSIPSPAPNHALSFHTLADLERSLRQFWEIEEPRQIPFSEEDSEAEHHFQATFTRNSDGRYTVNLPFRNKNCIFSDTYQGALARFISVERRLSRDSSLHQQYVQFMREYTQLGHMKRLSPDEINVSDGKIFYMPHHPVVGRKLRVVFDGSFKDVGGNSLNDALLTGPNIQRNLFGVCLRFRLHRFVFSADVVKMFRQILVAEHHRNFQRILWRESPATPIGHFQLCTVTYGTSCAPFLAVRVLKQLAADYANDFPRASKIVQDDFYVDDVLTGASSETELLELKDELTSLMSRAGLQLDKWVSNSKRVSSSQKGQIILQPKEGGTAKVLGLYWNHTIDTLGYQVQLDSNPSITKRRMLSEVARIFDPLGLLSPVVVQYKILFQELWQHDLDWDTRLPEKFAKRWLNYRTDLENISALNISRFVGGINAEGVELLGFCDASTRAYAAAVYYRTKDANGTWIFLLKTSASTEEL